MKKLIAALLLALVILTPAARADKYPFGITGEESIEKMACLVAAYYEDISFSMQDYGYSIVPKNGTIYEGNIVKIAIDELFADEIMLTVGFLRRYDAGIADALNQIIADISMDNGDYNSISKDGIFNYDIEWDDFELSTSYHANFNEVLFAMMWFIPIE